MLASKVLANFPSDVDFNGRVVVDLGCGNGAAVRRMEGIGSETAVALATPVQPAPDTMVKVTADVDYDAGVWTVRKVGS